MRKESARPTNNYERNLLLVKRFGGKFIVLLIPLTIAANLGCIGYLSATRNELMELTLLRVITQKINPDIEFQMIENIIMIVSCLFSIFFIFALFTFILSCRDPSYDAKPDFGLAVIYAWSMTMIILFSLCFAGCAFSLIMFIFKKVEFFEDYGKPFGLSVADLKAYKLSIIMFMLLLCAVLAVLIWFSQSQAEFVKSIRLTLVNSAARNKGAHTFGVFSMSGAVALICIAGIMTFMYYCYADAFNGLGINMDKTYVYVSFASAYLRGLIPLFIAISAFVYSEMVDEANNFGNIYEEPNFGLYGGVTDPNLSRKKPGFNDNPNIIT